MNNTNLCRMVVTASLFLSFPLTTAAQVGTWSVTPRVSIGQIYTDNIELSPPGEEDHEWVTELDAGFVLEREGPLTQARLLYNLQGLAYWRESDRNDVFHQLDGEGSVEVVPELLFVQAFAGYDQGLISRDGPGGDNINITGNRTDIFRYGISPVLVQRWGDAASGQLRYVHRRVDYRDSEVSDDSERSNQVLARLDSGPAFSRLGWALAYQWSETDFDDGSSATFRQIEALARWHLTASTSVFAAVGDEDNDFTQDPSRSAPDDTFWRVGATFDADARTFVEGYVGERYFGTTYGGVLRHRLRDGVVSASYVEGPTTSGQFEAFALVDDTGQPVVGEGRPVFPDFAAPGAGTDVFLSKRATVGFFGERRRLTWEVGAYDERREYERDDTRERVQGVGGNLTWAIQPRTRLLASGSVEESTFADQPGRDDTLLSLDLGLERDLRPRTAAFLVYSYRDLDSNEEANEYRENRVTATVRFTF